MDIPALIEQARTFLAALWLMPGVKVIASGVAANTVLAIAVALKRGDFNLRDLGDFLGRDLVPKVLTYGVMQLTGDGAGFAWAGTAALTLISASLAARIAGQLVELGLPLPDAAKRAIGKNSPYARTVAWQPVNLKK
jgi:hypothetical protein